MKKFIKLFLLLIIFCCIPIILYFLNILTQIPYHILANASIIITFIVSFFYILKKDKKTKHLFIMFYAIIIFFYLLTFIINYTLVNKNQKPLFYWKKIIWDNSTEYFCLNYAINEVPVTYLNNTTKHFFILYSYKDRHIGINIFPRYVRGEISNEKLLEYLNKN